MENIIKELKKESFSGNDILTACDGKTKIITYPELYDYRNIDDVLYPHDCCVLLYETKKSYGHWTCLIKHDMDNTIEFFDSYGFFIDEQLEFIPEEFRKKNNEVFPILSKMLVDSDYKIIYNPIRVQKYKDDVSSCGRHVAFRLILKHLSLKSYIKLITSDNMDTDSLVTYLTAFIR